MFKNLVITLLSLGFTAFALPALAQSPESENSMKLEDAEPSKVNKVPGEDADELIENNKLRAETGSKSRWSVATSLSYNGGTISRPFSDFRPNIQVANGQSPVSDIEGGINIKYNITQRDSIFVGETVRFITPLSSLSQKPQDWKGSKLDSYDPGITYQRIYNMAGLQSYFQVGPNIVTRSDYTKIGYLGNVGIYNVNAYRIGKSRFTVGLETSAGYEWFRNPTAYPELGMTEKDTRANSSDYTIGAFPYFEYTINDRLNLRTVCMYFNIEHTLAHEGDFTRWTKDRALQSVGLGISVTRDIFLYPNVQFVPDQIRGKDTNVALTTNINIF